MNDMTLAESCLVGKQNVDKAGLVHAWPMPEHLKDLLIRRLNEEMERQEISDNELSRRAAKKGYKIAQNTVSLIKSGGMNLSLKKLEALAAGLDVPAWLLLAEGVEVEHHVVRPVAKAQQNVLELPPAFPKIFSKKQAKVHQTRKQSHKKV